MAEWWDRVWLDNIIGHNARVELLLILLVAVLVLIAVKPRSRRD